jgi:hypothetical protein
MSDQVTIPRMVVCAAIRARFTGDTVLGPRHYDSVMRKQIDGIPAFSWGDPVDQGFVDQHGEFMSRQEAWKVAVDSGQIRRRVGGDNADGGTLYSENIY